MMDLGDLNLFNDSSRFTSFGKIEVVGLKLGIFVFYG